MFDHPRMEEKTNELADQLADLMSDVGLGLGLFRPEVKDRLLEFEAKASAELHGVALTTISDMVRDAEHAYSPHATVTNLDARLHVLTQLVGSLMALHYLEAVTRRAGQKMGVDHA